MRARGANNVNDIVDISSKFPDDCLGVGWILFCNFIPSVNSYENQYIQEKSNIQY